MKAFFFGVLVTLAVLILAVYLTSVFGLFPIGADNQPSKIERELAHEALDNYVERHAPKQENPTQITDKNLLDGALHYEEHCALCHGGAKAKISPLAEKFNPKVPQFINRVPRDPDANLYWVTKHGVRLSAMPSWDGVISDEEIWKIVAFIKHSDKLPPAVDGAWKMMAGDEHPPEHESEEEGKEKGPKEKAR